MATFRTKLALGVPYGQPADELVELDENDGDVQRLIASGAIELVDSAPPVPDPEPEAVEPEPKPARRTRKKKTEEPEDNG